MITFTNTVELRRPVQEVFEYLADLENLPEWNWAISEATELTPGAPRDGTRYRLRRTAPRPGIDHLEITALEPVHRLVVRGTLNDHHARFEYRLSETPSGTSLRNHVELVPHGLARLLPGVAAALKEAVSANLDELANRVEARYTLPRGGCGAMGS